MTFEEALTLVKADCGSAMGYGKWGRFIIHVHGGKLVWGSRLQLIDRDELERFALTSADLLREDWEFDPSSKHQPSEYIRHVECPTCYLEFAPQGFKDLDRHWSEIDDDIVIADHECHRCCSTFGVEAKVAISVAVLGVKLFTEDTFE